MRKTIIAACIGASMGIILASMGYSVDTWQYWVFMMLLIGLAVNSKID